ncbi:ATP-dependent DNA helicase pfh1-like [Primulina eburnea]|uniref:ATP-dependent DNA helicase pfh1-like n=1 Tax=Primulina eburnea TaxID=1245227 RepID=UPI003C6C8DE9
MKLLSFSVAACRYFNTEAAPASKISSAKHFFFKNKKFFGKNDSRTPKRSRIKWTDEQKKALDAVCNGQSVFITGSAGTGKTFLLQHIIKRLKKLHGKSKVYVTAPTGVAACALNGQTLHSFAGIGLGEVDRASLLERVLSDKKACYRWKKAKALLIDEASMVDAILFENLEHVARSIRVEASEGDNRSWGGLQLIVSGDFFQLPPILKKKKKVAKVFAFEADCWDSSFDLQMELTKVFRQSDALLIKLLQGIRKGEIDDGDLKLLEGCCSGYEPDPSAVRIFPRIEDVERVNKMKMESLDQEVHVYKAEDLGEYQWTRQLKSGIAPDELELCVGARVMLTKNISTWRNLVNGATGTVKEFYAVSEKQYQLSDMCSHGSLLPVVEFDSGIELVVQPEIWVVLDGDKMVAARRQIPLILSWALSIHKCQGMTLEKLDTNLLRVFDFGMVYVALSRVKSLGGLHLSGLNPKKIKAHPKVLQFYQKFSGEQQDDKKVAAVNENDCDSSFKKIS